MKRMKKIIIVVMLLALSSVAYAADEGNINHKSFRITSAFCFQKLNDIDIVAYNIKSNELMLDHFRKDYLNDKEKNYSQIKELQADIKEYEDKIAAQTHLLADIVSIYHAAGCDMLEAMQRMYCPINWSKDCEWVYDKPEKSKVKSNP
jgi:hypothetical protein